MDFDLKNYLEGNWHQAKGKISKKWGKITDNELEETLGRHEEVIGSLQKHYNLSYEEAKRDLEEFLNQDRPLD